MIFVDIHRFPPAKTNLYTYQNAKNPRFVDNMVDNVDKRWWITHTANVNNVACKPVLTHGKRFLTREILQEFLPEKPTRCSQFRDETSGFLPQPHLKKVRVYAGFGENSSVALA
jgi:hypothetical protein